MTSILYTWVGMVQFRHPVEFTVVICMFGEITLDFTSVCQMKPLETYSLLLSHIIQYYIQSYCPLNNNLDVRLIHSCYSILYNITSNHIAH